MIHSLVMNAKKNILYSLKHIQAIPHMINHKTKKFGGYI